MIKIVGYYLTEKVRIISDTNNYVPEILIKRTAKKGKKEEGTEDTGPVWVRFGYFSKFEGALNRLIEIYPTMVIEKEQEKNVATFKTALKLLKELKNSIVLKVVEDVKEIQDTEEEKKIDKKRKTRKQQTAK